MEPNENATTSETVEAPIPTAAATSGSTATSTTDAGGATKNTHGITSMAAPDGSSSFTTSPSTPEPTPEDISKIVTRESRKQVEALLKDAGIESDGNPEMKLKDYKRWLDSQKSDLEKAQGEVQTLTNERDTALAQVKSIERRVTALSKGVPGDKADQYVVLAETYLGEDGDFDKAMDAAIAAFPTDVANPDRPQIVLGAKPGVGTKSTYTPPKVF